MAAAVPPSWFFLNGLLNHVVKELNVEEALKSSILVIQKAAAVPPSWSFLNGLLNHVIKELNVEEVLKSPIFVVQKAAAPKNGVEQAVAELCQAKQKLRLVLLFFGFSFVSLI